MCEAVKGPAALQERGITKRSSLYHETLERGEHAKEHKEPARCMITVEATRLLHQKLRLPVALPCRHFSRTVSFRTTVFIALRVGSRPRVKCDPYQASFLHASGESRTTRVSSESSTSKTARKLPRCDLKFSNNNR